MNIESRRAILCREPLTKSGYWRERYIALGLGIAFADFFHNLLDQKVAKRHPGQPRVAVADRIEHHRIEVFQICGLRGFVYERRDSRGNTRGEGHFNKYERIIRHCGMEKGKAHAVLSESRAQIVPALNGVHRFVLNDALQHRCRRVPVNHAQLQKAAVKPGNELVLEVGIDPFQLRMVRQ